MTTRSVTDSGRKQAGKAARSTAAPALPEGKRITARLSGEDVAVLTRIQRKTGIQREMEVLRMGLRALAEKLGV